MKKYLTIVYLLFSIASMAINNPLSVKDSLVINAVQEINDSLYIPQTTPYEYIPDVEYGIIEDRLSCADTDIPMHFNHRVKDFISFFAIRDRSYTKMIVARKDIYFPIFEKYLKKYNMPDEIKYLAVVESGLKAEARSRAGAVGLWQFMPATGRMFGLHNGVYVDERRDPEKSTEAAVKYLKSLYGMFNNWELALAAYNAGPGNIRKAIRRSGYKRDFWTVYPYLPRETRSYVPQFVALYYLLNHLPEHNFLEEYQEFGIDVDTIIVKKYVHLGTLTNLLGLCEGELAQLNPEITRGVVPETAIGLALKIPNSKIEFLKKYRVELLDSASKINSRKVEYIARHKVGNKGALPKVSYQDRTGLTKIFYKVRSGDVIGTIAEKYHVGVSQVRRWNNLRSNTVRIDQKLAIWVKSGTNLASKTSIKQSKAVMSATGKTHIVQEGDTLWDISRKYNGLSIERLKQLNKLINNRIKPGQALIIG